MRGQLTSGDELKASLFADDFILANDRFDLPSAVTDIFDDIRKRLGTDAAIEWLQLMSGHVRRRVDLIVEAHRNA